VKDWIPTTVAFANSAPIDFPCVLFIGARNDGTIEGAANLDSLQQTYTKRLAQVYPPLPTYSRIVARDGLSCLAIVVSGSSERPHFPCHALKRVKSETTRANDAEVRQMLDERNSKVYQLLQWVGKTITVDKMNVGHIRKTGPVAASFTAILPECNRFWLTVDRTEGPRESIPLHRVELSYDHERKYPKLEVTPV
jgi:hypothetical protein